jgi:large subunit ribosomal protein L21
LATAGAARFLVDTSEPAWYRFTVMYAIIETGGKQFRVSEGDVIACDLHEKEVGSDVTFDSVVLAHDGKDLKVGVDALKGASVSGTVVRTGLGKKILVFRYKPKKRVRKLNGHRQPFAEIKITKISL